MPKISQTSKMQINGKRTGSWSLPAGESCPGSKDVEVCKGCYAKKGMYRFPVVKAVREYNKSDYHNDDWIERMVAKVKKFDYFRWFDSGDIETPELAKKISEVIGKTPNVKHWLPTRSDKISSINKVITLWKPINSLTNGGNVSLRLSADNIGFKKERPGVNSYVIRPADLSEAKKRSIYICPVTLPGSTQKSCDTCTYCYGNGAVAYVLH